MADLKALALAELQKATGEPHAVIAMDRVADAHTQQTMTLSLPNNCPLIFAAKAFKIPGETLPGYAPPIGWDVLYARGANSGDERVMWLDTTKNVAWRVGSDLCAPVAGGVVPPGLPGSDVTPWDDPFAPKKEAGFPWLLLLGTAAVYYLYLK